MLIYRRNLSVMTLSQKLKLKITDYIQKKKINK